MNATETKATEREATKATKATKAEEAGAATTVTKTRNVEPIPPAGAVLFEYTNNRHSCIAAPGCLPEDLENNSELFSLIAANFTRLDDVRVIAAEGTWMADLIVVDSGPGYAVCRLVQVLNLPPRRGDQTNLIPPGFTIRQASPGDSQSGYLVYRTSDGVLLNAGHHHGRKQDAVQFLLGHASVRGENMPTVWRGQH